MWEKKEKNKIKYKTEKKNVFTRQPRRVRRSSLLTVGPTLNCQNPKIYRRKEKEKKNSSHLLKIYSSYFITLKTQQK